MMNWKRWRERASRLRAHPRPGRFLLSRALWHGGLSSLFTIDLADGLRVRFYPSSISAALWVSSDERSDDAAFVRLILRPGDTYLDCGANIGHLAIVARNLVGLNGLVTAIEANPRIFRYCVGNLELNGFGDVLALNLALGDTHGVVRISDRRDDDQNRIGDDGMLVPMRPLDEIVDDTPVTLLKLDVEGYELPVLRGAKRTLEQTGIVYCELSASNAARFGYDPSDVEDLLLDTGFLLARRKGDHWAVGRARLYETLVENEHLRTGYNLVAIKPDTLAEFEHRVAAHGHTVLRS